MRARLVALAVLAAGCSQKKAKAPGPEACLPLPTPGALLRPGALPGGGRLLPGGRIVAPAGDEVVVGQNPLQLALAPDGATLAVAEFGVDARGVSLLSPAPLAVRQRVGVELPGAFLRGLAFTADGAHLWAANTGADRLDLFARGEDGAWSLARSIAVQGKWPADLALSSDERTLYVSVAISAVLQSYDAASGALLGEVDTGGNFPHALLLDRARGLVYVANEGSAERGADARNQLAVFDAKTLLRVGGYAVGKNPAALALAPDGRTLYVAASDDDWIDRIDLEAGAALQPFFLAPPGAAGTPWPGLSVSPSALAVAPDGATLYVTAPLAGAVLVLDARTGRARGAIPAGWRPGALALADGGSTLFVANQKGDGSFPTSLAGDDPNAHGTVQRIAIPTGADLDAATARAAALWTAPAREAAATDPACVRAGPLPARRGAAATDSDIRHVVVILKENKTFDAVFGDFPGAEARPDFVLYPERVTPNQHALAREFCLLDNFYTESEQSVEGHFWMAAQTTTDYFERVWGGPWGHHVVESVLPPGGLGNLDSPRGGFVWESLTRAGVAYQSYGEFVGYGGDLQKHIDLRFVNTPLNFLHDPDTTKVKLVLDAIAAGKLLPFTFVALQWDHTYGARAGLPSPQTMVADNDLATGQLVEAISRSQYWKDTLILITEDDPADGADHVDAHRSFALVVSPWARRGRVSHARASFPSLAATWERALGLPPLSTFDATAEPLWDCLAGVPDARPFTALPSNVVPRLNRIGDPGEAESRELDFTSPDRARGLGRALWRALRPGDPVPAAIERAAQEDEDDR